MACCCKGRPRIHGNATIWKIDVATGQLIWAADRAVNNSQGLDVVQEGTEVVVYEGGGYTAAALAVTKWLDSGDGGDRVWNYGNGTKSCVRLRKADDDSIWISFDSTTAARIDTDGAEITTGTVAGPSRLLAHMSSGNMNYWLTGTGVNQYDTSFSSVASISTGAVGSIIPLSNRHNWHGDNGWIWNNAATTLRHFNSDLSTAETFTHGAGGDVVPRSANNSRFAASIASTATYRVYSYPTITLQHTITVASGTVGGSAFDTSNNLYFLWKDGSGDDHIASYDDAGAERWDTTILSDGTIPILMMSDDDMLFIRDAAGAIDVSASTDNYDLIRVNTSTGAVMWGAGFGSSFADCLTKLGDYVYICGQRSVT